MNRTQAQGAQALDALAGLSLLAEGRGPVPRVSLSIEEAALAIGISAGHVREAVRRGVIPVVLLGKRQVILLDSLRDALKANEHYLSPATPADLQGWVTRTERAGR